MVFSCKRQFGFLYLRISIVLICAFIFCVAYAFNQHMYVLPYIIGCLLIVFTYPFNLPKKIEIESGKIIYKRRMSFVNSRSKFKKSVVLTCVVENISFISIKQNNIERLFNVGSISFKGITQIDTGKYEDIIKPSQFEEHCFYGITEFDRFCRVIEDLKFIRKSYLDD